MDVNAPRLMALRESHAGARRGVRGVEKASASSDLPHHTPDDSQSRHGNARSLRITLVCQDETPRLDPFRDGPRLLPAFVAQVMGQMMDEWQGSARHAGLAPLFPCVPVAQPGVHLDRLG